MKNLTYFFYFIVLISCSGGKEDLVNSLNNADITEYTVEGEPSLRGVDVLNDKVAWISGSKGTFARTVNAGKTWQVGKINNDTQLDFRDIHAFSDISAIALSAGSPARIYKTNDGGLTWTLNYENSDSLIFFNSFDFCDSQRGIACSDPIRGNFLFIKTQNGGETWDTVDFNAIPKPLYPEGGYAASGTSVVYSTNGVILYGTGGAEARVIRSVDFGKTWEAIKSPLKAGESYGIYSIAKIGSNSYAIAGGSWQKIDEAMDNIAVSDDSGKNWTLTKKFPSGFESCVKFLPKAKVLIVSGTIGVDYSANMGETWIKTKLK
ncbi:MAG: hypothetical protein F9K37_07390, partial [Bacteroidales bacterium]